LQTNINGTTVVPLANSFYADYYKGPKTISLGYAVGGTVEYNIAEKFSIQSGLLSRKSGDRSNYYEKDPRVGFIYQTGIVPRFAPVSFVYNYYGIELPLNVSYQLFAKLNVKTGASVLYNIYMQLHSKGIYIVA
jgi:hypothetical protein